jgi:hypothetical protein
MRTPEHDIDLAERLEAINQDENPIERERKLNQFYEQLDKLEMADEPDHEQGTDSTPRT